MDNELNHEKKKLKITPKKPQYFQNKLFYKKSNKNKNHSLNIFSKVNKYKTLINQNNSFKNNTQNNIIASDFFIFNNKLLREAISLNSYKYKKKDIGILVKAKVKPKKRLKLLEKDIDFYSPEYKRLFSAQILDSKNKCFNQNKTYDRFIKNNIKKFLYSETESNPKKIFKKSLILEKKNILNNKTLNINSKNNKIVKNANINEHFYTVFKNNETNKKKVIIKYIKKRPNSEINKYDVKSNYKKIYDKKFLSDKNKEKNLNNRNKLSINIINFSIELDNKSNKYRENTKTNDFDKSKDLFCDKSPGRYFPISERNCFFNKKAKDCFKNGRLNISINNHEKKDKNRIYKLEI